MTALLAAFGVLALYSQFVNPTSPYAGQLVVLIGLAVAVDYSLFMISRYRTELRAGRAKDAAIRVASATAGRAVFFSGLAVMISIAGLFLLDDPLFRSMAVATIAVVAISVVGSLTFLPAVMAILGRRIDWGRIPYFGRRAARGQRLLEPDRPRRHPSPDRLRRRRPRCSCWPSPPRPRGSTSARATSRRSRTRWTRSRRSG